MKYYIVILIFLLPGEKWRIGYRKCRKVIGMVVKVTDIVVS
jgi:hypothetical protein